VTEVLAGYYEPDKHGRRRPESLYGSLKMWAQLHRDGIEVARCTVERLMKANGWCGATRAKKVRTTTPDPAATRAPDLVNRQFTVEAPNTCWWPTSPTCAWPAVPGNPLKLLMAAGAGTRGDENVAGCLGDVATDWCHEPVLKLDAGAAFRDP
jgi:hypothetical protein